MLKSLLKKREKLVLINLKVTEAERELFKTRAKRLSGGNVSAFAREAMTRWMPRKSDLVRKKTA